MTASTSLGLTLATALNQHASLGSLLQRVRDSKARLQAIQPLLPAALAAGVRAGPLDETGWSLLVDNAASAAKMRQFLPALEEHLKKMGWPGPAIRIKVLPRT